MPTGEEKEMLLISIGPEFEKDHGTKRKWGKLKQVVAKCSNRTVIHQKAFVHESHFSIGMKRVETHHQRETLVMGSHENVEVAPRFDS
jgi:hypothetical protein